MSFIDKALEKAKHLQQQSPKTGTTEVQASILGKEPKYPGTPFAVPYQVIPGEEISYTVTKSIPVDFETLRRNRITFDLENPTVAEEYRLLRAQIMQRTKAENRNTLMVTGPLSGEGKTLSAINLAITISQEMDTTALLVDADLRQPSVHQYFGLPAGQGLGDHLVEGVPIPDLLIHPEGLSKFVFLPGGKPKTDAAELIGSSMMANLVQELKHFYPDRYVIFDLPPLLAFADCTAFAPLVDGIILVVEEGHTPRESVQQCLEMLKGLPLLGFVLNKVKAQNQNFSYHYYQSYHQKTAPPSSKGWFKRLFQ